MSKQSGLGDRLFVAGYNLSGDIGSLGNIGGGPAALDATGIDKEAFEKIGGVRDGRIEFTSWFNPGTDAAHDRLSALPTTDQIVTYCRGAGVGKAAAGLVSKQIDYAGKRASDGAMTWDVNAQANGYGLEWGEQLTAGIRTDTTAGNGASLDGLAATAHGLQAYLHVFGLTGTSCTVTLHDSADGTSFAAITGGAFTAAAGITSQRIATAAGTAVRRHVRAVTTGTFTSCQFAVLLVRNATAVTF